MFFCVLCAFARGQIISVKIVFWGFMYFVFVVVWLSVPMQLIGWKDSSPN